MGVDLGFGSGRFGDLTPEQQATLQAARESGQAPQNGFGGGAGLPGERPGGGGGFGQGGGSELSPEQQATVEARRSGSARAAIGVPAGLLDAMIEFLEAKVK